MATCIHTLIWWLILMGNGVLPHFRLNLVPPTSLPYLLFRDREAETSSLLLSDCVNAYLTNSTNVTCDIALPIREDKCSTLCLS